MSEAEKNTEALENATTDEVIEEAKAADVTVADATLDAASLVEDVDVSKKEEVKKVDAKKQMQLNVYDFVSIIMSAFIIIAVLFIFAFRLVGVDGQSMENTLHHKDWLITMQQQEYVYGDIVVITEDNYFNKPLIKRVIARGGQTVDIDYATATVYVDGKALDEPYTKEDFILEKVDDIDFPYTVPEGKLFCMGDNRNGSTDSRSTLIGSIDERYILGKAVIRILPFGDFDIYDYEEE